MKKILIVSTVSRQFYLFEQGNIEVLKSLGYEVHGAANFSDENERLDSLDIIRHHFDIERSPFSIKNIKAYKQLKKILKSEKFDAVHCHSPMGGVLARLSAKSVGISKIFYTAHGFHFYKGAPIINWLVYYPVEKLLSRYTDVIICINTEDSERSKSFYAKRTFYVPGVGVDTKKIRSNNNDKKEKQVSLALPEETYIILSVGELNKNKNHEVVIRALAQLKKENIYYVVCGQGDRENYLKNLARRLGVFEKVKFLGYRNDVAEIYKVADIFAFPSYREGLSVSLMEAMTAGLPIVCSNIRGNKDLILDEQGGYLLNPDDINGFAICINSLIQDAEKRKSMGEFNLSKVTEFDKADIKLQMSKLYSEEFKSV